MKILFYIILTVLIIIFLFIFLSYICFKKVFYAKNKKYPKPTLNEAYLPSSEFYDSYRDIVIQDIIDARKMSYQKFHIKSFDGLNLYGKYYELNSNYPIEIMFHGYKGTGERDLSTGIKRAFLCYHNALIVDQRAAADSDGHVISFGINERHDCLAWAQFVAEKFKNNKIILTGISMGAATVLMASSFNLPQNVIGILSDCSYSKPSDIIKKVIKDMHLPVSLSYFFVKTGAKLFGHFDLEETSPYQEVQKSTVPIIFFHGSIDSLVPFEMSEKLYNVCNNEKRLVVIEGGNHGTSYLKNKELYLEEVKNFFNKYSK